MKNLPLSFAPSLALAAIALLVASPAAQATPDTIKTVNSGATDLTSGASYTPTGVPGTANDVEFTGTYTTPAGFTLNSNESFGTLNDVDATDSIVINNTGTAADTLTLSSQANAVSGVSSVKDILYVAAGANLSLAGEERLLADGRGGAPGVGGQVESDGALTFGPDAAFTYNNNNVTFVGTGTTTFNGVVGQQAGQTTGTFIVNTSGAGAVVLNNNSDSGNFKFSGGNVVVGANGALGTGLVNFSSATLSAGVSNINLANAISISGTAVIGGSNALTLSGAITQSSAHGLNVNNTALTTLSGGSIAISPTTTPGATFTFGGTGTVDVEDVISDGASAGGLVVTNSVTVDLNAANTYTGGTTLNQNNSGLVSLGNASAFGTGTVSIANNQTLTNSVNLTGVNAVANNFVLNNPGSTASLIFTGTHDLTLSGTITPATNVAANRGFVVDNNTGDVTLSGLNSYGGKTAIGTVVGDGGTLTATTIANGGNAPTITTTAGQFTATVSSGSGLVAGQAVYGNANIPNGDVIMAVNGNSITLTNAATGTASSVASVVGTANSLGLSTNAAANLVIANGSTFQYTGAAASTDRLFTAGGTVAGDTATLDASGTGAINFTNTGAIAYGNGNQARTLGLTGTNTGLNTLNPQITNNGTGAVSVSKTGTGKWVLANANTYTGGTTVSNGTLLVGNTSGSATGTGSINVAAGAGFGGAGTASASATGQKFTIGATGMAGSTLQVGNGTDATSQLTLTAASASTITNTTLNYNFDYNTSTMMAEGNLLNIGTTAVTFSGDTLALAFIGTAPLTTGETIELIAGNVGGTNLSMATLAGLTLDFTNSTAYDGSSLVYNSARNSIDLDVVGTAPEPRTWAMLVAGLGLLVFLRRVRNLRG